MGTTTFFLRHNDLRLEFERMTKKDLKEMARLSPWGDGKDRGYHGWSAPLELHNGNAHILVWWYGRLMRLEKAPENLTEKYYSRFRGKRINEYEWTVFKKFAIAELERLDKEFRSRIRRAKRMERAGKRRSRSRKAPAKTKK